MTQGTNDDESRTGADKAAEDAGNALTGVASHPFTGEPEEPARDEPDDDPERPHAESPGTSR